MILPHRIVVLINAQGDILAHFTTDRGKFPAVATFDRDRIFSLIFQGDLASLGFLDMPTGIVIDGALYKERSDVWRISTRTINNPRPRIRRRKTAKILQFIGRGR